MTCFWSPDMEYGVNIVQTNYITMPEIGSGTSFIFITTSLYLYQYKPLSSQCLSQHEKPSNDSNRNTTKRPNLSTGNILQPIPTPSTHSGSSSVPSSRRTGRRLRRTNRQSRRPRNSQSPTPTPIRRCIHTCRPRGRNIRLARRIRHRSRVNTLDSTARRIGPGRTCRKDRFRD